MNAAGAIIANQVFGYDAFGIRPDSNEALTTLLYSGEQTDPTGLQYLRARYYNLANGRFNRLDPLLGKVNDPLTLHKYLYANGNPVSGFDPSGTVVVQRLSHWTYVTWFMAVFGTMSRETEQEGPSEHAPMGMLFDNQVT